MIVIKTRQKNFVHVSLKMWINVTADTPLQMNTNDVTFINI